MKMRMSRALLGIAALAAPTVLLTATPTLASTSAPAIAPRFSVTATHGTTRPDAARPATDCEWEFTVGNVTYALGTIICEYGSVLVKFPNGSYEDFAVGTSHAVWTAWGSAGSDNWDTKSMGGSAYSPVTIVSHNGWAMEISILSSTPTKYCDLRGSSQSSGWSGWSPQLC
jgi:hypothetical protein